MIYEFRFSAETSRSSITNQILIAKRNTITFKLDYDFAQKIGDIRQHLYTGQKELVSIRANGKKAKRIYY